MKLTLEHYKEISHCFPKQRGNVSLSNLSVLNAILYIMTNKGKWRQLPPEFGNWHTVYVRMNRWSKNGTLDKIFQEMQLHHLIVIKIEVCADQSVEAINSQICKQERNTNEHTNFIWLPRLQQADLEQ